MKMAAVKLTSGFLRFLFRRDSPTEWRPPHQCEAGLEETATFLRAVNDHDGVTLVFGADDDPRFFEVEEGAQVPALEVLYTAMGNGSEVINALKELHRRRYDSWSDDVEKNWDFVVEAFRLEEPPEGAFEEKR